VRADFSEDKGGKIDLFTNRKVVMKRFTVGAVLVALGIVWGLQTAVAQEKSAASIDRRFVQQAAGGGLAEVQLGKMAVQRAVNAEVKQFGQRMVDDHTKANTELLALAQTKNIAVPKELDAEHKAMVDKLTTVQGPDFDREYIMGQVEDHEKAVLLFTTEMNKGQDAEFKAFAAKTLPTLKEHLRMVHELAPKYGERVQR
jgi:putative membrane protein